MTKADRGFWTWAGILIALVVTVAVTYCYQLNEKSKRDKRTLQQVREEFGGR